MPSGKTVKSTKAAHQRSPPGTKTEQKGRDGGEGEGRRQPGSRTSNKLLAPEARTSEGEEGGSKWPTLFPSLGGGLPVF